MKINRINLFGSNYVCYFYYKNDWHFLNSSGEYGKSSMFHSGETMSGEILLD